MATIAIRRLGCCLAASLGIKSCIENMSRPSANEDLALNSNTYLTSSSEALSTRSGAVLRAFLPSKSHSGVPTAAALLASPLIAALLIVASAEKAQAQLFPWGGWGNSNWQQKPRRRARPRNHYVEPKTFKNKYPIPETSGGPLLLVVSLPDQKVTLYDGTEKVITAPISSGTRSNPTPTGIFSILEKNRHHYSNLYGGAPMPFMQRLTNSGVALHAGNLPGYPASHGCIRLPYSFARNLFGATEIGARVIVTDHDVTPVAFSSPHLVAPLPPEKEPEQASAEPMATAQPVSGTKEEFDAVIAGVRSETSSSSETSPTTAMRTRETAAAQRELKNARLAQAITDAEDGVKAAVAHAEAMKDEEQEASKALTQARRDLRGLQRTSKQATYAASKAEKSFTSLTRKLTDLDAKTLTPEELDAKLEEELEGEEKLLHIVEQAAEAKSAAKAQEEVVEAASEKLEAAKQARTEARKAIKTAEQAVVDAKAALKSAKLIAERKDYPVSIFVSRKTGRLIAKLGKAEVIDIPVAIKDPETPIGTHVFTATGYTDGEKDMRWTVASVRPSTQSRPPRRRRRDDEEYVEHANGAVDPEVALSRIEIPEKTRVQLAELMKPRSSLIISDFGLSRETSERTEFVVEPWRVRGYR